MKKNRVYAKFIALMLITLILTASLTSCKARPLAQTKLAKSEVGSVGDYTVLYEELYYLAHNYSEQLKNSYTDDPEGFKNAVWERVNENITENYAILELCKNNGLTYDEKALRQNVEKSIKLDIVSKFDGSRKDYFKSQEAVGLTDHYVRFMTGVNLLYGELGTKLKEEGIVPKSDNELIDYIQKNFAHSWHIAIFVNPGENRDEKMNKLLEAQKLLENGTSMYKLIGSKYNEDPMSDYLEDTFGYYFPRGIMDEKYEDTVFSLSVGDHAIVESMAENGLGNYVECFYLVERLSTTSESAEEEIKKNLTTLSDSVLDAKINDMKEQEAKKLSFVPNAFAESLDITALEPVKNGTDYLLILTVVTCVLFCVLAVAAIILARKLKEKHFRKILEKKTAKR